MEESSTAMRKAYIGIGANLGQPAAQVRAAIRALGAIAGVHDLRASSLYRSTAIGMAGQPDYCNAVCSLSTALQPQALFEQLIHIERDAGRVRDGTRWGPRVLDLDLLHVEGVQLDTLTLTLPHPEIARRDFVVLPLLEIEPALEIPALGRIADLARTLCDAGLCVWRDETHLL